MNAQLSSPMMTKGCGKFLETAIHNSRVLFDRILSYIQEKLPATIDLVAGSLNIY